MEMLFLTLDRLGLLCQILILICDDDQKSWLSRHSFV